MDNRLKTAFDSLQADEALKQKAWESVQQKRKKRRKRKTEKTMRKQKRFPQLRAVGTFFVTSGIRRNGHADRR